MQTGTMYSSSEDNAKTNNPAQSRFTLWLLCIGYFIDFYDLTLFSASYVDLIPNLFNITDTTQIQNTYLRVTNFYTAGIVLGGILFGILGDKLGRMRTIRYSMLLYSITTIACIFTHSLAVFITLRFLAGLGLAAEFAISSVLISELLPVKRSTKYTAVLYVCGIMGGMTATYLSIVSWKIMFIVGGISGLILYSFRKKFFESMLFLTLPNETKKGSIFQLFNNFSNNLKFIKLFILIVPFNFLISIMFLYPHFMPITSNLATSIHTLLMGFFTGNILSAFFCNWVVNKFKDFRVFLLINIILFMLVMPIFGFISDRIFFIYALFLGLLGGGLPTTWVQVVIKSYGTNLRSSASGALYACGRLSAVGFNLLAGLWLINPQTFIYNCNIAVAVVSLLVVLVLITTKNNYAVEMNFLE